jgi:hypothetical protein
MPFYQFTVPADSATARKKAEVAAAVTAVHAEVTGAEPVRELLVRGGAPGATNGRNPSPN